MEAMYQRSKIQEESLHYERMKHTGEHPLVGVNMFIAENGEESPEPELTRATKEEKDARLAHLKDFHERHEDEAETALASLQNVAREGGNIFEELLRTVRSCSLGEISSALYEVGGQYRRSM
jgi:methylmalonyl-CoA mutase